MVRNDNIVTSIINKFTLDKNNDIEPLNKEIMNMDKKLKSLYQKQEKLDRDYFANRIEATLSIVYQ